MRESTSELLALIQASTIMINECKHRRDHSKTEEDELMWEKRRGQFAEAQDIFYEQLGQRLLGLVKVEWE